MSDDGRGLLSDYIAAHFRDEDERRSAYLDEAMRREPVIGDLCKRGHDDWGTNSDGARRCLTCHRMRMAEARAQGRVA